MPPLEDTRTVRIGPNSMNPTSNPNIHNSTRPADQRQLHTHCSLSEHQLTARCTLGDKSSRLPRCTGVEPGWQRVVQVDLEMDVTVDMVGSGSISWMVEYPGIRAGSEETETQIHIVQKELAGVIPLAMVKELLSLIQALMVFL
ncbi:hypothetical protein MHYP_G00348870 [Metynnis hypsauchen]